MNSITDMPVETSPMWYIHLRAALDELRGIRTDREHAVVITLLEQVIAYAWFWIVSR